MTGYPNQSALRRHIVPRSHSIWTALTARLYAKWLAGMQNEGGTPKTDASVITFKFEQVVMDLRCCLRLLGLVGLVSVVSLHSQTAPSDSGNSVATLKTKVRLVLV